MASALQLLRGEQYEIPTSYQPPADIGMGRTAPMPESRPAMGPPEQAEPSYAQLLAETGAPTHEMPMERPAPNALALAHPVADRGQMAQPSMAQPKAGQPEWMTPERRRMYEKAKQAAKNYRSAVETRRQKRKQSSEYSKLYHQMQAERGKVDQIENMMSTYKDLFRPDDPRTEGLIRKQMEHFESAERLTNDLRRRLQKYGVKIGPKDQLPEDPFGNDHGDEQFDQFIREGFNDALLADPYQ